MWHWVQVRGGTVCSPVSGHQLWLKLEPVQPAVVWQVSQVCGKLLETCGGLVVPLKSAWWQPQQVVGALL